MNQQGYLKERKKQYSIEEVRIIVLELTNAFMCSITDSSIRLELRKKIKLIEEKHNLELKEGLDYFKPINQK